VPLLCDGSTELVVLTPVDCKILDKPNLTEALEYGSYNKFSNLLHTTLQTEEPKTYTRDNSKNSHTQTPSYAHAPTHTYAQRESINATKSDKI
jgi:hypothetical protein